MVVLRKRGAPIPRTAMVVFALLAIASRAGAGVTWSCEETHVGDGLVRVVFAFESDDLPIAGYALRFESPRMKNIQPHGLWTVFTDNNEAFASAGVRVEHDTQWRYASTGPGRHVVRAPNHVTREEPGAIQADIELIDKSLLRRTPMQVVVPAGDPIRFMGVVGVDDGREGYARRKEEVSGLVRTATDDAGDAATCRKVPAAEPE